MAVIVQKYGGTSVGSVERIRNVAQRVAGTWRGGHKVAVVVSAMAGETNRLIQLVRETCDRPNMREYDVVVSTGEQVTIGLTAIALEALGVPSESFMAHQLHILTDSVHSKARILDIESSRLRATLENGKVAVIAGFQGLDSNGDVTTLGRGGSDLTAVAIAAALGADMCEIYTDVEGVFTTDPNICANARKIDRVSYDEMLEMASLGAKVLQTRSVEFAKKYSVPVHVLSSFAEKAGTYVVQEEPAMEQVLVSSVTYNKDEAKVSLRNVPDRPGVAARVFSPLAEASIVVDMILQNISREGLTDLTFTVPKSELARALDIIRPTADELQVTEILTDENISKVSIIGLGMKSHAGVAAKMFEALSQEGINIQMISTSEIKISCIIQSKYTELAVRVLHDTFQLGEKGGTVSQERL
ncbi:MAG: aspartate kinase [bacterium]